MNPVDIIANALLLEDDNDVIGDARPFAEGAASALTHELIVDHAVAFLTEKGWTELNGGVPIGDDDLRGIAAAVLRSVGA